LAYREGPFQDLRVPLTWTGAAAAIVAIILATALLFTDRREQMDAGGYGAARGEFDLMVAPVAGVLAAPVRWAGQGLDYVGGYFFAASENRRLRRRVAELERWRDAAIALKNINTRYEALLKLRTEPPIPMVSARVVSDARGPFSNARLADAGANKGVKVGNPVLSEKGVVGRVVGVSSNASRVLLLTDVDSRTPVLIDRTNARAILTGDGGLIPRLEYVRGRDAIREGDRILTSGDGGVYPRGLPVGVASKDFRGAWRVRLYTDTAGIDFVRILVFDDFSQMVDQAALATAPLPSLTAQEREDLDAAIAGRAPVNLAAPPPAAPVPGQPAPAVPATPGAAAPAPGPVAAPNPATPRPATPRPAAPRPAAPRPAAPRPAAPRPAAPTPQAAPPAAQPATPAPAPPAIQGLF
jgi:rod shape-determining protein MreC